MAKKKVYSLTARQRKELRRRENNVNADVAVKTEETDADSNVAVLQNPHKRIWVVVAACILGLLLILTAILLPILISKYNSKFTVATVTLEDGRKIKLEIWEDEFPIAATNFIFLAKIGYFDGTIIYDAQNDFVRFGGVEEYGKWRGANKPFVESVKKSGIFDLEGAKYDSSFKENMFGYTLRSDVYNTTGTSESSIDRKSQRKVLSYIGNSSSDFMINLGENNTAFYSQNSNSTRQDNFGSNLRPFAQVLDDDSMAVLDNILASDKNRNPGVEYYVATQPVIRIKSVKIINENRKKWKKFEFASYMNTVVNGEPAWNGWKPA